MTKGEQAVIDTFNEELKLWTTFDPIEMSWKHGMNHLHRPDISMFSLSRHPFSFGLLLFRLRLQYLAAHYFS